MNDITTGWEIKHETPIKSAIVYGPPGINAPALTPFILKSCDHEKCFTKGREIQNTKFTKKNHQVIHMFWQNWTFWNRLKYTVMISLQTKRYSYILVFHPITVTSYLPKTIWIDFLCRCIHTVHSTDISTKDDITRSGITIAKLPPFAPEALNCYNFVAIFIVSIFDVCINLYVGQLLEALALGPAGNFHN